MGVMGRVGILTQGRLSPEPRFTLPPCSRTGPRGWERGSVLRGWGLLGGGPLAREQLLLIRPERKQQVLTRHLLGALYQPAIQRGAEGAPCAHLPHAALAQILGRTPQQPPDGRRPLGASPASERGWRAREENGGPASGHTSGLGTAGSKKLLYFLLPKTWVW